MPKTTVQFICQQCGASQSKWSGRCLNCSAWESLVETEVIGSGKKTSNSRIAAKPERLDSINTQTFARIDTSIPELNQVLGGGIVPGSIMLLSGDPGIGKSTITLQIATFLANKISVLYVSGEESAGQIKMRAERLGLGGSHLSLLAETNVEAVIGAISEGDYSFVVIDSIQTLSSDSLTGVAGSVGQVTACAQMIQAVAKQKNIATLLIGHVTKEGTIAGPKVLEHLVDVVLYLEGDKYGSFKALRGIKNRFGSTNEVGIFEMGDAGLKPVENPSATLLAERTPGPGSVVLATLEGTRPILIEVQALVTTTVFGYPKRTAVGFDLNRLNLLIAVLTKRAKYNLNNQDIYVNIVGGLKVTEPAADLAIILSIASAFKNVPLKKDLVAFGEIGLNGEIRSVSNTPRRLSEVQNIGFKGAIGPAGQEPVSGLTGYKHIGEALKSILDT